MCGSNFYEIKIGRYGFVYLCDNVYFSFLVLKYYVVWYSNLVI